MRLQLHHTKVKLQRFRNTFQVNIIKKLEQLMDFKAKKQTLSFSVEYGIIVKRNHLNDGGFSATLEE